MKIPFKVSLTAAAISAALGQVAVAGPGTVPDGAGGTIPTYYANSQILTKFKDTLPGLSALALGPGYGPNNLGQYLPVASALPTLSTADILSYPGSDYYELGVVDYTEKMHSELPKATLLRGYVQIDRAMTNRGYDLANNTVVANPAKSTNSVGHKLTNPDGTAILIPLEDAKHNIVKNSTGKPIMVQAYAFDKPHYLGPVIVAMKDRATRIKFNNLLKSGSAKLDAAGKVIVDAAGNAQRNGDLFIPTDHTLAGTELIPSGNGFSNVHFRENRAILHLHGGSTPWISDGTPHQWIVPADDEQIFRAGGTDAAGHVIPPLPDYARGMSTQNVPDMPDAGPGAVTYYWTNRDSGRLMMYHDHTSGTTRLNPYVGEAAGFVIADDQENKMMRDVLGLNVATPGVVDIVAAEGIPLVIQDRTWVPGDIATQDALWDQNAWGKPGDLWFPHVYETAGVNPAGRWDWGPDFPAWPGSLSTNRLIANGATFALPTGAYGDVTHVPEAFMDTPTVNGTAYPTLTVDPKAYRFRILSVGNDRAFNLGLYVAEPLSIGVKAGGSGYTAPTVTITPAAVDTTATYTSATAVLDTATGAITAINVVGASGYTVPPTVTVTDATGIGATFVASANTEVKMVPFDTTGGQTFPAGWGTPDIYTNAAGTVVDNSAAGLHPGGVPDPATAGPHIFQIGTEGGLADKVQVIPSTITNYESVDNLLNLDPLLNPAAVNFPLWAVKERGVHLAPAERLDAIIDFSKFAGKTLILYNDSPAPSPGPDPRYDYYTGDADQTAFGGAPTTLPGQGPNTRTVMQFKVSTATPVPFANYDAAGNVVPTPNSGLGFDKLTAQLPAVFAATQDPMLSKPLTVNNIALGASNAGGTQVTLTDPATNGTMTLTAKEKTIFEDFDFLGRITATLGTWLPDGTGAAGGLQNPQGYINPNTDTVADGTVEVWRISHNGVDMHPLHWHLVNLQVLGRVGWDGVFRAPDKTELGWKETIELVPMMDTLVAVKAKNPKLPFGLPRSARLLDPAQPAGGTAFFTPVDPNTGGAANYSNQFADFNWEYVWHCHILGHEENDLMRPLVLDFNATAAANQPVIDTLNSSATTLPGAVSLKWADKTPGWNNASASPALAALATDFTGATNPTVGDVAPSTESEVGFRVERASIVDGVVGAYAPLTNGLTSYIKGVPDANGKFGLSTMGNAVATYQVNALSNATSYVDASVATTGDYSYRVVAVNAAIDTTPNSPTFGNWIGEQPSAAIAVRGLPATPTGLTVDATGLLKWTDAATNETAYRIERAPVTTSAANPVPTVGVFTTIATLPSNNNTYTDTTDLTSSDYQYRVVAVNGNVTPALESTSAVVATPAALPAAPQGLTADTAGNLAWFDMANNETSYRVERATVDAAGVVGVFSALASGLPVNSTSYTDATLVAGTNYQYRVFAVNAKGEAVSNVFALSNTPAVPTNVSVSSAGLVDWLDNSSNETGFRIDRATVTNGVVGTFAQVGTVAANISTYSDTTIAANTDYQYQVVALNGTLASAPSAAAVLAQAPAAATGLAVAPTPAMTARALTLTWLDNSTNEDGFSVEASTDGGTTYVSLPATPVAPNIVTYAATVTPATSYTFRVGATKNLAGYTPVYTTTTATTPAELLAATGFTATATLNGTVAQAALSWVDASTGETTYTVERCAGTATTCAAATANWSLLTTLAVPAGQKEVSPGAGQALGYTDTTLASGASYIYRVKAAAGATVGPVVTSAQVATPIAMVVPANLTASSPTGANVVLSWTDTSTNETSFQVERATAVAGGTPVFAVVGTVTRTAALKTAIGGGVTFTDATALAGSSYLYQVRSVNLTGTTISASMPSNQAAVTLAMPAPTGLTATQSNANMVLSWKDTSATETSFEVRRTDLTPVNPTAPVVFTVARTAAQGTSVNGTVSYTDITAVTGTTYQYDVRAVNTPVVVAPAVAVPTYSAYSNTADATVVLPAPTLLTTAIPATGTGVALSWNDNATFETGYRIDRTPVTLDANNAIVTRGVTAPLVTIARTGNVVTRTGAVGYTDATTVAGQAYAYQVYAMKGTVASLGSNEAHTGGAVVLTGAPTQLTANTSSGTSVVLSWIDNTTTETSFLVTRTDPANVATLFTVAAKTGSGTSATYTDATAALNTTYTYTVAAITPTAPAPGLVSAPVTATLGTAAPANASVAASATGITVGWTDMSNNETGFQIVRNVATFDAANNVWTTTPAAGTTATVFNVTSTATQKTAVNAARTYIDTTALPGVTYYYTVASVNGTVISAPVYTTPATIQTSMVAPSTPTVVVSTATRLTVSWTDLSTNETGFIVERAITPVGGVQGAWTVLATTPARTATQKTGVNGAVSYVDNLVAPVAYGTYQYRVTAVNQTGVAPNIVTNSSSAPSLSAPVDFTPPAAPTLLTAAAGATAGTVNLTWTDNATSETGFTVQRATNATFTRGLVTTAVPGASAAAGGVVNYTLNGLTTGTKYFYRVAAVNGPLTSAYVATTVAVAVP